jgi:hypothetical protein
MIKQLLFSLCTFFILTSSLAQETKKDKEKSSKDLKKITATNSTSTIKRQIKVLRKKHAKNLANSPFKKTISLSKSERKAMRIPPNKYYEMEWELTMDPEKGVPTPENLIQIREKLIKDRAEGRTPGDASDNLWVERGPNNVGGRVRVIMFDPTDTNYSTVISGGVSGGLWKNTNISSTSSTWTRLSIPENLNITSITYDPNNSNIWYAGTGESYVGGDVNGDGVWKSSNAGLTWTKVLGGINGTPSFSASTYVTINSPSNIAGDYVCFPTSAFGSPINTPITQGVVLIQDSTAPNNDGCETLTNAPSLAGKIALIRRGSCTFVLKVKAAQDAGAIAVIMINNVDGTPVPMGGQDATITIPSVMISKFDGDLLAAALASGTINATINQSTEGVPTGLIIPGLQNINDVVVRNNAGNSEIYVAAGDGYYSSSNAFTLQSSFNYGLYKSIDGGASWTQLELPLTVNGANHCPNDIEIGSDGKIWVSTTQSWTFGNGGGNVFSSSDGQNFDLKHTVSGNGGGQRTEIEISNTNPNKIYVLTELAQANSTTPTIEVKLEVTNDGFATTPTVLALPTGNETREITYGFTGGQAFYDLLIESDPNNDQIVYVGGIDLYRTANGGASSSGWVAISNWTTNTHADHHAMTFKPGNSNIAVFGNDGGVYYSGNLINTSSAPSARVTGLNITQFYSVGVAPTNIVSGLTGDYFAAGAQDNGTQYFSNATAGVNPSVESQGGDGAFTMFDQDIDKYYISNYVYNQNIVYRPIPSGATRTLDADDSVTNNGAFIASMVLDSNLDLLYSDYSNATTSTYRIRRYSNIKSGTVVRTNLVNTLLNTNPSAFAVSPYTTTSTTLLVGTRASKLLRVTNANATATWADISGPNFVGSVSDVEYGASNNEIYLTMHNYNVVNIWYTNNGGTTWINKEGNLPDMPVKCILRNPLNPEEVIVGTELGVWYTNNFSSSSPSWNQSYNGMSNVKVTDLDLRNDNTVFAATYGRGIFSGVFTSNQLSNQSLTEVNNNIKIYPNPSNGVFTISLQNFTGKLNYSLYDINGRAIFTKETNYITNLSVDLKNLQRGTYFIKLEGELLSHTEKLILN